MTAWRRAANALHLALALALAACAPAGAGPCEDTQHARVLQAAPGAMPAQALWLDRRLLRWPGADPAGIFKLYFAPSGGIDAPVGAPVRGAAGALTLNAFEGELPPAVAERFGYVGKGATLALQVPDMPSLRALHRQELVLVQENGDASVRAATRLQAAGALDDLYANAAQEAALGVHITHGRTAFRLWAPSARRVTLCRFRSAGAASGAQAEMALDAASGVWSAQLRGDLSGQYYAYQVEVFVPGTGVVRNTVTDPYSVSLSADSARSYVATLDDPRLAPPDWRRDKAPATVRAQTDMLIYELHVRDFSIGDATVPPAHRGKFAAFSDPSSNGMRHLAALRAAGLTDIHLLPVFDFGSVPEAHCDTPHPAGAPDGEAQQELVKRSADTDCFNWGYDPLHYSAPEGSYATNAADGARRIVELRTAISRLHRMGLRVGMDVVYNHTFRAGQDRHSILDRIVPGYYHRLNADGAIEQSTCCFNTATENRMMAKLMIDSTVLWATHYKIDSFRFDLMAHQPRAVMEQLGARVDAAAHRHVQLIGEGWNFGEVADGARFIQASQLALGGSGIGTFSDRARDAVRGGAAGDSGALLVRRQGYINGLAYDPNEEAEAPPADALMRASDMVKLGLAGSIRSYALATHSGQTLQLQALDYGGQSAGYASEPAEVVNYVENHDNQTLFDINALKLPLATSSRERARVQILGAAINAFSQGVSYFHAGIDTLRSKSFDRNSFNSGDWFNRLDWSYRDNGFGAGAPPKADNGADYPFIKPRLANAAIKPAPQDIAFTRDAFRDLLRIRASSTLFRLRSAADIVQRLRFYNTGPAQEPTVIAARLDGAGYPGAAFRSLLYFINVDKVTHQIAVPEEKDRHYALHPVQRSAAAADQRARAASYDAASGAFTIPARSAVVFVE
ncbi:MAG: alpha-1,6-glucosidase domain-containing protein [Pseudomonadota bacterium]